MTEDERKQKNAICDHLMHEGIDGRDDADAVPRICVLTQFAGELGRKDAIACALGWYEDLDKRGISGEQAVALDYQRANAIANERYGTEWKWEQATLAREIFFLRRAISSPFFAGCDTDLKCMCLNNLGNRLRVAGREIEALDCWRKVLELQPNFGMSLSNRARVLTAYAGAFENQDEKSLFLWAAHREASAAIAPTALYAAVENDERNRSKTKELKEWIESILDVKAIDAISPLKGQEDSGTGEEREYRDWCLANRLYLNLINDLGEHRVAAADTIGLATHVVPVDSPHIFESFFDQMKQEYVSARWSLYEGLHTRAPHFSDKDTLVYATEPRPSLCLAVEQVKGAYRTSYSLFDKIGFFVNAYMELGIPERQVTFRTLWRPDERQPIRREFDQTGNWGFCALYWLSKDFFEKTSDEVAEPQARGLSEIRNSLEHKYLRVTAGESPTAPPQDLALMVPRSQLEAKALHLLKLVRAALIYLAIGVRFEEQRREPSRVGMTLDELSPTAYLPDDEKI
ncbi:MAG: LA2681 family HEPN domain-containing protein [Terracidiphilus sp.]|jgi:hypothetical protein